MLGATLAWPTIAALLERRADADPRPVAASHGDGGAAELRQPVPDGGAPGAAGADGGGEADATRARGPAGDPRATAREAMRALSHAVQTIQRIGAKAPRDAYSADCVIERLAEARIGVRLGDQEFARLEASLARQDRDEERYALRRLDMLVARAAAVLAAARICATDDPGGITATKVEVEISPAIPAGDPTGPPPPPPIELRPANDGRH
jgi:hypothetical protein